MTEQREPADTREALRLRLLRVMRSRPEEMTDEVLVTLIKQFERAVLAEEPATLVGMGSLTMYRHLCDALGIQAAPDAGHEYWDSAVARVRALAEQKAGYEALEHWAQEAYQHRFDEVTLPPDIADGLGGALATLREAR